MDERIRFVARLLEGEKMAPLCREFNIARKTVYKIFNRYKDCGVEALCDRTRRPIRFGNQLPFQVEQTIVALKKEKPSFGAQKIRELIIRKYADIRPPAISTVHAVLDRYGLVSRRGGRRRNRATGSPLSTPVRLYSESPRRYKGIEPVEYPLHDRTVTITHCGRICIGRKKVHLSHVFAGHTVGLRQIEEAIWLISFMQYDLGFFDMISAQFEPLPNP